MKKALLTLAALLTISTGTMAATNNIMNSNYSEDTNTKVAVTTPDWCKIKGICH